MASTVQLNPAARLVWQSMVLVGLLLAAVGMLDLIQLWVPLQLGIPEWEYGTASSFFDQFPAVGLGLALMMGGSLALGWRWSARSLGILCLVLAIGMWLVASIYLTVVPFVFKAVREPVALTGVKKGLVKTLVQALVYPLALLWLAGLSWWGTKTGRRSR
jgi:hypothetical protein